MRATVEHIFTGSTTPYTSYDSTKTNLGRCIAQMALGTSASQKFAGPYPNAIFRSVDAVAGAGPLTNLGSLSWSSDIDWIFCGEAGSPNATKRIGLLTYVQSKQSFFFSGFITVNFPTATNHTVVACKPERTVYTTGTASCSASTAVTGSGSAWVTYTLAAGARIGFGTTDPTQVTTWYYISSINNDTSITLTGAGPNTGGSVAYVIEEIRLYVGTFNATATNGGLFVVKGLNADDFTMASNSIAAATTTDNIKACYWLADAATVTNTAICGMVLGSTFTGTSHDVYFVNGNATTSLNIYKFNGRAALSGLSSGKSTAAFVLKTGTLNPTATQNAFSSAVLATTSHGPGSGVECIYLAANNRMYRIPTSMILQDATNYVVDTMHANSFGGLQSMSLPGWLSLGYSDSVDRFLAGSLTKYEFTRYASNFNQADNLGGYSPAVQDQAGCDAGYVPAITGSGAGLESTFLGGMAYVARKGNTGLLSQTFAFPIGANYDFAAGSSAATQARLITPALSTPNASSLVKLYVTFPPILGSDNLGQAPEPFRVFVRTSGITDDTGTWLRVSNSGDLSMVTPGSYIQVMIEFRTIGPAGVQARVHGVHITYETLSTLSNYQPSLSLSNKATSRYAWRFATAFGTTVSPLRVRIYHASIGNLLVDDNTTSPSGTWQKSTDGGSTWGGYNTSDKSNETTYIRYTPNAIPVGVATRAILTLL